MVLRLWNCNFFGKIQEINININIILNLPCVPPALVTKKKKNLPILVTNGFAAKFGYTLWQPLQM